MGQEVYPIPKNKLNTSKEDLAEIFCNKIKEDPQKLDYLLYSFNKNISTQLFISGLKKNLIDFNLIIPEKYYLDNSHFKFSYIYSNQYA